jgi:hypothetical protein
MILKGNPRLHYKNDAIVDFKVPKTHPSFVKANGKPALPTFSNDRKYFTPAFSLTKLDEFKEEDCVKIHKQKVEESLKEIDE